MTRPALSASRSRSGWSVRSVTRSYSGASTRCARLRQADFNLTALVAHPTCGFKVRGNRDLDDVSLAGLAFTLKQAPALPPSDLRLFYLYYEDDRDKPVKVDS